MMFKKLFLFFAAFSLLAFSDKASADICGGPQDGATQTALSQAIQNISQEINRLTTEKRNAPPLARPAISKKILRCQQAREDSQMARNSAMESDSSTCKNNTNLDKMNKTSLEDLKKTSTNKRNIFAQGYNNSNNNLIYQATYISCEDLITAIDAKLTEIKEKEQKCGTAMERVREAKSEFKKACSSFSRGNMRCDEAAQACAECPSADFSGAYNCVKIHNQTKCPALAGKELEEAKEKISDLRDKTQDIQDDIGDSERDLVENENDLKESLAGLEEEFSQTVRELERKTEEEKAGLEGQLKKSQSEIKSALAQSLAKAQAQIDESLKIAHSFENALFKANREYRAERRKIIMACEAQAQGRLAQYRQKRRSAIQTGSLKISLSSLLRKGRTSFASKDTRLLKSYNAQCLSKRKPDFKEAGAVYKHKLRIIEQQKEQYQEKLGQLKRQFANLSQQASQQENSLIQSYGANMQKIIDHHGKEYKLAMETYLKAKKSLLAQTKQIALLQKQLFEKKRELNLKQTELLREQEIKGYLKSSGANDEEDTASQYTDTVTALSDYSDRAGAAYSACSCEDNEETGECAEIKRLAERAEEEGFVRDYKESGISGQR